MVWPTARVCSCQRMTGLGLGKQLPLAVLLAVAIYAFVIYT